MKLLDLSCGEYSYIRIYKEAISWGRKQSATRVVSREIFYNSQQLRLSAEKYLITVDGPTYIINSLVLNATWSSTNNTSTDYSSTDNFSTDNFSTDYSSMDNLSKDNYLTDNFLTDDSSTDNLLIDYSSTDNSLTLIRFV